MTGWTGSTGWEQREDVSHGGTESTEQTFLWTLLLTSVIEAFTAILRFGFKVQSTRDTAATVGMLTHGIRLHHCYFGVLILIVALLWFRARPAVFRWMLVVGMGFVLSDMIHHFLVLWPIVGSPEFHLVYPSG